MMVGISNFPRYGAYKDSGVESLGEIPADWNLLKTKFLTNIQKGNAPDKLLDEEDVSSIPYLSMDYLRGKADPVYVPIKNSLVADENAILLLWDGSNSGEFIKGKVGAVSSTLAKVEFSNIDTEYAWFACSILERALRSNTVGMGIPHVDGSLLRNTVIPLPPSTEQRVIAKFLDQKTAQIDQAIAIKERQIELLQERKQIIIQQAVTQGLNPDVPMKDSGVEWIGQIPEHWETRRNFTLFKEMKNAGKSDLPVLSVSIHNGVSREELTEQENIRSVIKIEDRTSYKEVQPGDIAYNMMRAWQGGIGAVYTHGMVSPAYVVARPLGDIESEYFELLYRTALFIRQMDAFSKGITDFRKRLYWDEFRNLITIVPPFDEQLEISKKSAAISIETASAISIINKQTEKLREYKTTLINSAVTGKIKITPEMVKD